MTAVANTFEKHAVNIHALRGAAYFGLGGMLVEGADRKVAITGESNAWRVGLVQGDAVHYLNSSTVDNPTMIARVAHALTCMTPHAITPAGHHKHTSDVMRFMGKLLAVDVSGHLPVYSQGKTAAVLRDMPGWPRFEAHAA